jgi:hypothetical protein
VRLAPRLPLARAGLGLALFIAEAYAAASVEFDVAAKLARTEGGNLAAAELIRGECGLRLGNDRMMRESFRRFLRDSEGDATLAPARRYAQEKLAH